jgi:hypothetical protein
LRPSGLGKFDDPGVPLRQVILAGELGQPAGVAPRAAEQPSSRAAEQRSGHWMTTKRYPRQYRGSAGRTHPVATVCGSVSVIRGISPDGRLGRPAVFAPVMDAREGKGGDQGLGLQIMQERGRVFA